MQSAAAPFSVYCKMKSICLDNKWKANTNTHKYTHTHTRRGKQATAHSQLVCIERNVMRCSCCMWQPKKLLQLNSQSTNLHYVYATSAACCPHRAGAFVRIELPIKLLRNIPQKFPFSFQIQVKWIKNTRCMLAGNKRDCTRFKQINTFPFLQYICHIYYVYLQICG